jgi:hypothetical protein
MRVQLPQQAGYSQDQHGAKDFSKEEHDRSLITTMDSWIEGTVKWSINKVCDYSILVI